MKVIIVNKCSECPYLEWKHRYSSTQWYGFCNKLNNEEGGLDLYLIANSHPDIPPTCTLENSNE